MRLLPTTFFFLVLIRVAGAADPDVRASNGEPLTWDKLFSFHEQKGEKLGRFRARVAAEGYRPKQMPAADAKDSGAKPIGFLEELLIIGLSKDWYYQAGGDKFLLMGVFNSSGTVQLVGYVPEPYVMADPGNCMRKEESGIAYKAMVVISRDHFKKAVGSAKYTAPRVRLAPHPEGKDEGEFRFFDFYFVWADTDKTRDSSGYALLGDTDHCTLRKTMSASEYRSESKILGWVEKSRLCFWRTREAVQWDDLSLQDEPPRIRTRPGVTFGSMAEALAVWHGERPPADAGASASINEEPFQNSKPARWEGDRMRYPILPIHEDNKPDIPYKPDLGNFLRRVGIIGDIVDENNQPIMTRAQRDRINLDLEQTRQEINRTQILFVIDRTVSMEDWWVRTAKFTRRLIDRVKGEGRTVEVGFCYYGDATKGAEIKRDGQVIRKVAEEGEATLDEMVQLKAVIPGRLLDVNKDRMALEVKLRDVEDTRHPLDSGLRRESVFAGLEIGLIHANWNGQVSAPKARKMVILIGDDGNHPLSDTEQRAVFNRIARLVAPATKSARRSESPIEFYAIQVCQVSEDKNSPTVLFQKQMEELVQFVRLRKAPAEYFNLSDEDSFFKEVDARYTALRRKAQALEEDLDKAGRGQYSSPTQFKDPEARRIFEEISANSNVSAEVALQGVQLFEERWVWQDAVVDKKREPQVRRMLLVGEGELDDLINILTKYFSNVEIVPSLRDVAVEIVLCQAGRKTDGTRLTKDDLEREGDGPLRKKLAQIQARLELSCVSKLIHFLGWDLPEGSKPPDRDEEEVRALQDELNLKLHRLRDLKANRVVKHRIVPGQGVVPVEGPVENPTGRWKRGFQRLKSGAATGSGSSEREGTIWYWVDIDREWP